MRADIRGGQTEFNHVFTNSSVTPNLLYISWHDYEVKQTFLNSGNVLISLIYTNQLKVCTISRQELRDLKTQSNKMAFGTIFGSCVLFPIKTIELNPQKETISKVELHRNSLQSTGDSVLYKLRQQLVGASIEILSKTNYDQKQGRYQARVLRIPLYKHLIFPEINIKNQIWINDYGDNYIMESQPPLLIYKRKSADQTNALYPPYFGYLNSSKSNSSQRNQKRSNLGDRAEGIRESMREVLGASISFSDGRGHSKNLSVYFYKVPKSNRSEFNLVNEKIKKFKISKLGNFTNIFFSRPISCLGFSMVNFSHSHQDKYEIYLEPVKPIYHALLDVGFMTRENVSNILSQQREMRPSSIKTNFRFNRQTTNQNRKKSNERKRRGFNGYSQDKDESIPGYRITILNKQRKLSVRVGP